MYSNALRQKIQDRVQAKGREKSSQSVQFPSRASGTPFRSKFIAQNTKNNKKAIHANIQSTVEQHVTPKVYELDSTPPQRKFKDIDKN
jgi:hypothetical protein